MKSRILNDENRNNRAKGGSGLGSGLGLQQGSILLEGLIAILIFSIGILAIVGMQGAAVRASSDAKYRSEASMQASLLIGRMRVSNLALLTVDFVPGGTAYSAWAAGLPAVLPNSDVYPPSVAFSGAASNIATVTVNWLAPGDTSSTPHNYVVVAQIQ